ncbi:nucleotidyltransferase family protein [Roseateles asaccharophilus]|uniref:Molybdenum cofactor cytidylyltransferase n=1 Tax=Roseateles asaccharophilus TaxID=582607 RepID=A0ABU2A5R2_9BURK|nr:nucleotidyltransferase family protein [Roseateles asaccharophilus]MDR7332542.1 molybdenum cofactor cytidylyltransferase [Roseateles asaccharophilus]
MKRRPAVVVLAAGRGTRFRGPGHKLEQKLSTSPSADTLLARTLRQAIATQLPVVVVTTPALTPAVHKFVAARDVVTLPEHDEQGRPHPIGMGHSIVAGVSATGDADGWLILPADMPLVQSSTIVAVAEGLERYPVCYAQYRGIQGHPVGFGTELYSELMALQGDEGARRIVARYAAQPITVDDPGVHIDVDTAEDLARLRG